MKAIRCLLTLMVILALARQASAASSTNGLQFSGKVVSDDGHPIAGATVESYEYEGGPGMDLRLTLKVATDADGHFSLPLPRTWAVFVARKAGLASAWRQSPSARNDLANQDLVLHAATSLAGVVIDERDQPVASAEVFVSMAFSETSLSGGARTYGYLNGKLAREMFHAKTGADGRFQIDGISADTTADLAVHAPAKALRTSGRDSMISPDSMPWRGGDKSIKLIVEPAGTIEGRVVTQEGDQRLGGVQIFLGPKQGGFYQASIEPVRSGSDGTFKIADVGAGSYRLSAIFGTNMPPDWVAEPVPVTVEVGQSIRGLQLAAVKGALAQVRVTSKTDHQPLAGAMISAYREDFQATAKSATNGTATLRLLPGDYQVNASRDTWRGDNLPVSVQAGQTNLIELELSPPARISGIVRRPDGQPAVGAELRIVGGGGPMDRGRLSTDSAGRFEIEWDNRNYGQMRSTPCLLVRMPQNGWAAAHDLDGETGPLDLHLALGVTLAGDVKSSAGQPVTNVTAALVFWTGRSGMHLSDLATGTNVPGHFEITALPPGRRYGVNLSAPGFGQRFINQVAADKEGKVDLETVELSVANLKLAGQLLDQEEKPVPGVYVNLQGEGQPNDRARTDREGRFNFDRVCEGSAQLFANLRNSFANATAQGGDTNVILRLGEQTAGGVSRTPQLRITGIVTGLDGKPVTGARVRLFSEMSFDPQWTRADSNGAYKVTSESMPGRATARWVVARDATGKLCAAAELADGSTQADLQLKSGGAIQGLVRDVEGKPMPKAALELMLATKNMQSPWEDKPARPDAQGQFEIGGLPAGLSYCLYASAPGYGRAQREFTIEDPPDAKLTLTALVLRPANLLLAGQVVNEDQKPVANAQVQLVGNDQPQTFITTDRQGRFKFQVCEGPVRLFVHSGESFANSTIDGGETNAVITLAPRSRSFGEQQPRRRSLQGSPLPDLASVGLATNALPAGGPGLLVLLDFEQRKSKRALRQLSDQMDALKLKGLAVAIVQIVPSGEETWQELKNSAGTGSLVLGRVTAKSPLNRWATETARLPWLILTDKEGRVAEEGFNLVDLETELSSIAK